MDEEEVDPFDDDRPLVCSVEPDGPCEACQ